MKRICKHPCVTCVAARYGLPNHITESVEETVADIGCIPDQSNCALSTYTDYKIEGGVLLQSSPALRSWNLSVTIPAVCNFCLDEPRVRHLVWILKEQHR